MPFTVPEALADLAPALALVQQIQSLVAALPAPTERKMKDYSDIVVAILPNIAALVDEIEAQAKS